MTGFRRRMAVAAGLLAAFAAWTIAVQHVDVQPIGPQGSQVGFAAVNQRVHRLSGVHWLTDIAGGALLSAGLVMLYSAVCCLEKKQAQT